MENNLSKAYAELLLIFSYMDQIYVNMIPKKLLELFNEKKDKNYQPKINPNISLSEQNLQRKTLALLAMINLNYWCKDENKRKDMLKMYAENDKKKEKELREIYNTDNLFKKQKNVIKEDNIKQENTELIVYKGQNKIMRLLNKIKRFLKINH